MKKKIENPDNLMNFREKEMNPQKNYRKESKLYMQKKRKKISRSLTRKSNLIKENWLLW
jgi:hypothetical protein